MRGDVALAAAVADAPAQTVHMCIVRCCAVCFLVCLIEVLRALCVCPTTASAVCSYVVMHLAQQEGWKVYAVSRKDKPQYEEKPGGLGDNITPVQVGSLPKQQAAEEQICSRARPLPKEHHCTMRIVCAMQKVSADTMQPERVLCF
jgi:hypothetical protein